MDDLSALTRKVPHNSPAEQAVIGSMLIDSRCVADVIEKLNTEDFYDQIYRDIYDTIKSMFVYGDTIDTITVIDKMKVRGVYAEGAERVILEAIKMTPTAANVLEYAKIVSDRALLRRLGDAGNRIISMTSDENGDADIVLEAAEKEIYALRNGRNVSGLLPISGIIQRVFDDLSEAAVSGNKIPGLSTGLPDLDRMILGLNKSDFILIAARPGMGKTSIALNMALYAGMTLKKTVAVFSLEMSREQLVTRLLSKAAMVPSQNLLTGQLSEAQWKQISDAAGLMSNADIRIDDNPNLSVSEMNAACRRVENLGLVVIDYLQLMQSAGSGHAWSNESRVQAVSDISRMLKIMAKELNVPVICLSQLNRAAESRTDKRPMLADLRESGAIEQDADVVIGLYRDGYYNKECENPNLAEAIVLKNRKGQTGTTKLMWLPEYTSFMSYEENRDEDGY